MLGQLSVLTEYHVVQTVAREPNLTALKSAHSLLEEQNRSVDSGKKQHPGIKASLHKSDFVQHNVANYTPTTRFACDLHVFAILLLCNKYIFKP
jgi:hypothetical protein